jgi:myo-inositol 2-dehydrogenase/D-chiro-inositol 1-dehydrogenase
MPGKLPPVRVGLVGCGHVTENFHLPALRSLGEARVVALADVDAGRLKAVADRFGVAERYADFHELVGQADIEVVGICTPPRFHVEMALAALEAAKHVFIEKPLGLDVEETDRLTRRARGSSRKLMVGFNLRHHVHVRAARALIRQGRLGAVELVRTVLSSRYRSQAGLPPWRRHREQGGGVFSELAVHHFDLLRFLLESEIEEVFAVSRPIEAEDRAATIAARMTSGPLVSLLFAQHAAEANQVEVFGQHGRLLISFYRFDGLEFAPAAELPGGVRSRLRTVSRAIGGLPRALTLGLQGGSFRTSYRAEWRHFIDCIRGDRPVDGTLEDGQRALQAVLAAMRSATVRSPVHPESMRAERA